MDELYDYFSIANFYTSQHFRVEDEETIVIRISEHSVIERVGEFRIIVTRAYNLNGDCGEVVFAINKNDLYKLTDIPLVDQNSRWMRLKLFKNYYMYDSDLITMAHINESDVNIIGLNENGEMQFECNLYQIDGSEAKRIITCINKKRFKLPCTIRYQQLNDDKNIFMSSFPEFRSKFLSREIVKKGHGIESDAPNDIPSDLNNLESGDIVFSPDFLFTDPAEGNYGLEE